MPASSSLFSPKQVAEALQVSESSVKRWCDQGLISMMKTAGGHRRIPLEDLLRFIDSSERPLLKPMAIGLEKPPRRFTEPTSRPGSDEQIAFRRALQLGNEVECRQIVQEVLEGTSSLTLALELLITDAMHCMGDAWQRREIDVYQERRGCEICQRILFEFRQKMEKPNGPTAIGCAAEGDVYQIPTAMVELALREAGWAADSLGNDLPFPSIQQAVVDFRPALLWLSISTVSDQDTFVDRFNALADWLPEDCMLLVGGRALNDGLRPRLRYTAHCDNLRQLVGLADVLRQQRHRSVQERSINPSQN